MVSTKEDKMEKEMVRLTLKTERQNERGWDSTRDSGKKEKGKLRVRQGRSYRREWHAQWSNKGV